MNNSEFFDINISDKLEDSIDKAIANGIEKADRELRIRKVRRKRISVASAAALLVIAFTFGISNQALAAKLLLISNVFKEIEEKIQFPGDYSGYATSVEEAVYDNGVKVTLSQIMCDGEGLYVTYKIESDELFKYTSRGEQVLDKTQLMTSEEYNKVSFSDKELDNTGFAGLEGEFIDENTFIGMERYYLKSLDTEIPDNFEFEVKLKSVGTAGFSENDKGQNFYGTWAFKVPVKVDKGISKNIAVNYKTDKGLSLDYVFITPVSLRVNTTNPENYHYGILVYDDKNNQLRADMSKIYDDNKQISYFSAVPKDSKTLRVVIYRDILIKKETTQNSDGSYSTLYEDTGDEIFVDKTIEIK